MRWGSINEFQSLFSEASRPTRKTVREWIADPEVVSVVGKQIRRSWYIDLDHFQHSTGDALADRILRAAA